MTRARLAELLASAARGPLTQVEIRELLEAVEQSFGAVDAETDACAEVADKEEQAWFSVSNSKMEVSSEAKSDMEACRRQSFKLARMIRARKASR